MGIEDKDREKLMLLQHCWPNAVAVPAIDKRTDKEVIMLIAGFCGEDGTAKLFPVAVVCPELNPMEFYEPNEEAMGLVAHRLAALFNDDTSDTPLCIIPNNMLHDGIEEDFEERPVQQRRTIKIN